MTPSKILFFSCLSFLIAVVISSLFHFNFKIFFLLFSFFFFLSLLKKSFFFLFFLLPFSFGLLWTNHFISKIENSPLKNFEEKNVELTGTIKEIQIKESFQMAKVKLKNNFGEILIFVPKSTILDFGDEIKINGKIKKIKGTYFLKEEIAFSIYYPKIEKIGKERKIFGSFIFQLKEKTKEKILHYFGREKGAFLLALLYGDESYFKKDEIENLNRAGVRHITAVSGMNITILTQIIFSFFIFLGFFRKSAFLIAILFIVFYLIMIGFPASGVRAAIMAFLLLISQFFGRQSEGEEALVLAATVMVFFNPLILLFDLGFQLSFLSMLGIISLQEFFLLLFKKIPKFLDLRYNLATTISAQIFVFPLLIYNFGNFPLIAPLSNIFVLPLLPFLTILGILFLIFSFSHFLSLFFSFLISPFLNYLSFVVKFFSFFPPIQLQSFSLFFLLISYFILFYFTKKVREYLKLKILGIL